MRRYEQRSHCSTWPPSVAVRHAAMARRTWRCSTLVGCVRRYCRPCARTTSATSNGGRAAPPAPPAAATSAGDGRAMTPYVVGDLSGSSAGDWPSSRRSSGEIWADTRWVVVCR